MVQLLGADSMTRTVTELANRLDVPLNLVSRLGRQLEARGFVRRTPSPTDARVTLVRATANGARLARRISNRARARFATLQEEMTAERRLAALEVWAGNFGVALPASPETQQAPSP
ncbi:MarR family transcriptional regulator [Mycobacterium paraense]|uniref:MarR family transcriptional regulator n=1 Tax=Mycobacterium paraense TaxID=767916 RepID=UPI003B984C3C